MRKAVLLLSLVATAVFSGAGSTSLAQESITLMPEQTTTSGRTPAQSAIPDKYLVVLNEEVRDPTAVAREHAQRYGAQVLHTYQHALKGYAARIPDQQLDEVLTRSGSTISNATAR